MFPALVAERAIECQRCCRTVSLPACGIVPNGVRAMAGTRPRHKPMLVIPGFDCTLEVLLKYYRELLKYNFKSGFCLKVLLKYAFKELLKYFRSGLERTF